MCGNPFGYDAWGKLISITGSMKDTLGVANPFRYRSYYYDTETGFYYLQSRYYDPETGRFLNADDPDVLFNYFAESANANLFQYCFNDPVNYSDYEGYAPTTSIVKINSSKWKITLVGKASNYSNLFSTMSTIYNVAKLACGLIPAAAIAIPYLQFASMLCSALAILVTKVAGNKTLTIVFYMNKVLVSMKIYRTNKYTNRYTFKFSNFSKKVA